MYLIENNGLIRGLPSKAFALSLDRERQIIAKKRLNGYPFASDRPSGQVRPGSGASVNKRMYKNIGANWLGLFANLVVGFFLTPFMLHRLGDNAFGLWALMSTFTGYYGLLDLGIRNAIIRYIARHFANNDWAELASVASTCLFTYLGICVAGFVLTAGAAWQVERLIAIPSEFSHTAKLLVLIVGVGTALGFPLGIFGGLLEGLQQFTWVSAVQVVAALFRAGLILLVLEQGYGLLAVAAVTVIVNLLSLAIYPFIVFRLCPQLKIRWRCASKSTLRTLAGFGFLTVWVGVGTVLRFQTDALVIGALLSLPAISMFSIGSKLSTYANMIVQDMAQVFTPLSSHFDARGDLPQLRQVLLVGNRYSSFVILPITVIFLILGKPIIRVWAGAHYVPAYPVLIILILPLTLGLMQAASTKVLYGMARQAMLARVLVVEGVMNLLLSILLVRSYGIIGVALGTAIPMIGTNVLFLPRHLCRLLGLPLKQFLHEAYSYPLINSIVLAAVLWTTDLVMHAHSYFGLLLEILIGSIPYGLGLAFYFYQKERPEQPSRSWAQAPAQSSESV